MKNALNQPRAEQVINATLKAICHPLRREIIGYLKFRQRVTSGDIASRFTFSWPTITNHLSVLKEAGIVSITRDKNHVYYELNTRPLEIFRNEWLKPILNEEELRPP